METERDKGTGVVTQLCHHPRPLVTLREAIVAENGGITIDNGVPAKNMGIITEIAANRPPMTKSFVFMTYPSNFIYW